MATLMIQGTASGVGKSLLTAGLCRLYARRGVSVAPFKAQNMSNQAAVTAAGGEIGRAQAVQAEAAGIAPHVDMNPVLIKPEGGMRAQVVLRGRALGSFAFGAEPEREGMREAAIRECLARLRRDHELVLIEGAGSPAEINLRDRDRVNMWVAREADAPVLLVGNIDPGGVFAQLVGTLALLDSKDRARVAGLIINQLRGDPALLAPGIAELEARAERPCLGVIPILRDHGIDEEDAVHRRARPRAGVRELEVAVVALPHLSNFDDVRAFEEEPGVVLRVTDCARELLGADLVVLPGSKQTRADLAWLRAERMDEALLARASSGSPTLGICGGCQMLGARIEDPKGVEGPAGDVAGIGLLSGTTRFAPEKRTDQVRRRASGWLRWAESEFGGYVIHHGRFATDGPAAFLGPEDEPDGEVRGAVAGTMTHGLFVHGALRHALLRDVAERTGRLWRPGPAPVDPYERLADHLEAHLDIAFVDRLLGMR